MNHQLVSTMLILVVLVLPVFIQVVRAQTEEQIQQTIAILQKQLKDRQDFKTNTLASTGLEKPTLTPQAYDKIKNCNPDQSMPVINSTKFNNWWKSYLTDFHCGHVLKTFPNNNTAIREFKLEANDHAGVGRYVQITKNDTDNPDGVLFPAWQFNNTTPGPTMRMTQGDHIRITIYNSNQSIFPHSFHMHSIHSGSMDGMTGQAGNIAPGAHFTYEFIARPFGVYPYHCHMEPIQQHIQRGLYGMMIIDPPTPRPPAKEMVMLMNGYSFNRINITNPDPSPLPVLVPPTMGDLRNMTADNRDDVLNPGGGEQGDDNQFYTVNGKAFGYSGVDMLHLVTHREYRIYLVNMLEFDPVNSFHLHGNLFNYFPSGTSMQPDYYNDIIILGQGDRAILETSFMLPGDFMFHSHINRFSNLGWQGLFHVTN
jgi:FtsP/CotA-like multicopper oxidase with cupredoxin domain